MTAAGNSSNNNNNNNNDASVASTTTSTAPPTPPPPPPKKTKTILSSIFSTTCFSSVFMIVYIIMVSLNLYKLMYPLAFMDLTPYPSTSFIHPLWNSGSTLDMKVYLSSRKQFHKDFLVSEFTTTSSNNNEEEEENVPVAPPIETVLLWKQEISSPSLSKSFLLTNRKITTCATSYGSSSSDGTCDAASSTSTVNDDDDDASFRYAKQWLDEAEKSLLDQGDGGVLSTISAAGQGIESTSVLLTMYQSLSEKIWNLLSALSLVAKTDEEEAESTRKAAAAALQRSTIHLPSQSPMWNALQSNSTLYIHVLVTRRSTDGSAGAGLPPNPKTPDEAAYQLGLASRSHSLLVGQVDLVKYDPPHHLSKPGRILYHDIVYLFQKYILQQQHGSGPPWDMQYTQPEYHAAYEVAQQMKEKSMGYPYWKPEVAIKYVIDEENYPKDFAHISGMELVRTKQSSIHPTGIAHIPALHVDEIGLTSEKYIPINETVTSLPLRITFDRNDLKLSSSGGSNKKEAAAAAATTATAGGISPARWRLLSHLSESIESQKQLGFEQSDIDDVRRLVADTNLTLLGITMLASALHLLFEFLTFKSEVNFWKNNTDLTGLSVRSLFLDFFGQVIIVLFLLEKDSSLLMTIPSAFGCIIALWKCQKAAGLAFVRVVTTSTTTTTTTKGSSSWLNAIPRLFGFELRATRLDSHAASRMEDAQQKADSNNNKTTASTSNSDAPTSVDLHDLTMESDRIATATLGSVLLPCVLAYTLYSLLYEEHTGWYSWLITSASSAVYALGFVLMTPQLFLNYKLKSVAHLPWRVLVYKSLNTFIDDLFSFIIRMPTMARISCFRDDIVFFIYLYQRWLYPVDTSRPVEGGGDGTTAATGTVSASASDLTTGDQNNNNITAEISPTTATNGKTTTGQRKKKKDKKKNQ